MSLVDWVALWRGDGADEVVGTFAIELLVWVFESSVVGRGYVGLYDETEGAVFVYCQAE